MINNIYFHNFPELESARLLLRKQRLTDAPDLQLIRSDKTVMKFMDSDYHLTVQQSENFIEENLQAYTQEEAISWALIEKSTQQFIGDFTYWKIDKKNSRAEIGYTLKPQFWGNGYMTEAMVQILKFGFNNLKLHSIEANVNPKNEKSKKLLKRIGFRKEGYFRENYYFDGAYLDSEIFSLLKSDFK